MERTEITLSKWKLVKLLFYSSLFIVAGLWMLLRQPETGNPVFNNFWLKNIAAGGGVLLGIGGMLSGIKKLSDTKPGVIIDETGLTDNSGMLSVGFIPWADVTAVAERVVKSSFASKEQFITLYLRNPDAYINKQKNGLKRRMMNMNYKYAGSPVSISSNTLKIKFDPLFRMVQEAFEFYKSGN